MLDKQQKIVYSLVSFKSRKGDIMKVRCSLKSAKTRDKDCKVVKRKGRVYVINKTKPKFKARQG